jgi:hypothetical protein
MNMIPSPCSLPTNDADIRIALKTKLEIHHVQDKKVRIIEELGIHHGAARIDIAVINGLMHGYEIKSDLDTLFRLPEQIEIYNAVFDKVTLVVGKSHLFHAINIIPDWWGVLIAKNSNGEISFNRIRDEELNRDQDSISLARLLWRKEALGILEGVGAAKGLCSKSRDLIYEKLAAILDRQALSEKVREIIFFRTDWRPDAPLVLNGG